MNNPENNQPQAEPQIYVVEFRNLVYNGTLLFLDQLLLMVRLVPLVTEILNWTSLFLKISKSQNLDTV